jgi:hypothetical protein
MVKILLPVTLIKPLLLAILIVCGTQIHSQSTCAFTTDSRQALKFNSARLTDQNQVMYIPVVFHIVYNGATQNISNEQIYSQLTVINEDFSKTNSDASSTRDEFKSVAADVGIQFYLAEVNNDIGITRTSTSHEPFFNDDLHLSFQGGKDGWDTSHYLNVWVANLASGVFGYGSSPGTVAFKDGVAIHYEYFGRGEQAKAPYNLGRTLTHEIGHWLGLQHLWGTVGDCKTDDGLTDTPAQADPTFGCALNQVSCGALNMVQNFMNTSYDQCMTLFTTQQKEVMRNAVLINRTEVYTDKPIITRVIDLEDRELMMVYPNPVVKSPVAYIRFHKNKIQHLQVSLIDMVGKEIRSYNVYNVDGDLRIDLHELSNGIYFARVSEEDRIYSQIIQLNLQ